MRNKDYAIFISALILLGITCRVISKITQKENERRLEVIKSAHLDPVIFGF